MEYLIIYIKNLPINCTICIHKLYKKPAGSCTYCVDKLQVYFSKFRYIMMALVCITMKPPNIMDTVSPWKLCFFSMEVSFNVEVEKYIKSLNLV